MYSTITPDIFLNQTYLVRLGIFQLELGKNILFGFGNGAEFRPQISEIESPDDTPNSKGTRGQKPFFVH